MNENHVGVIVKKIVCIFPLVSIANVTIITNANALEEKNVYMNIVKNVYVKEIVTTKKSTVIVNPNNLQGRSKHPRSNKSGVKVAMIDKNGKIKLNMENDLKTNPHIGVKKKH